MPKLSDELSMILESEALRQDAQAARTELTQKTLPLYDENDGIWRIYCRRCATYCQFDTPSGGEGIQYRPWAVNMASTTTILHTVVLFDAEGVQEVYSKKKGLLEAEYPVTSEMVLAALHHAMLNTGKRPAGLVVRPGYLGSFRSVAALEQALHADALPGFQISALMPISIQNDMRPYGINQVLFSEHQKKEGDLWIRQIQLIEPQTQQIEQTMSRNDTLFPCFTESLSSLSIWELKLLYRAASIFHDSQVYKNLPSEPLEVTVPDLFDASSLTSPGSPAVNLDSVKKRSFVVIVCGMEEYDSRGVYAYNSWEDMLAHLDGGHVYHSSVDFMFSRKQIPPRSLDHIAELALALPQKGPSRVPEDGYPWFCCNSLPIAPPPDMDNKYIRKRWGTAPPREDMASLALAILAVTKFGQDVSKSGTNQTEVAVDIELDDGAVLQATVSETEEICNRANCTFECCFHCRSPKAVVKKLSDCSSCRAISYCSPACQRADWKRHKLECNK